MLPAMRPEKLCALTVTIVQSIPKTWPIISDSRDLIFSVTLRRLGANSGDARRWQMG